jgi:hypothetical protein
VGEHDPLSFRVDVTGRLKGPILGNVDCWYNLFRFCTDHLKPHPKKRLLQRWNIRQKKFGAKNYSKEAIAGTLQEFHNYGLSYDD